MSAPAGFEQRLSIWLDLDGPGDVPPRLVEAALAEARNTRQRVSWLTRSWWDRRSLATGPGSASANAIETSERVPTIRVTRPSLGLAWMIVLAAILLALLVGLLAVGSLRNRSVVPAAACPPGSTPNTPGPVDQARPSAADPWGPMVFDRRAGRMVLPATESWADFARRGDTIYGKRGEVTWTFDVCTNRWHKGRVNTTLPDRGRLVYDEDSDLTLLIADDSVWSYDPGTDTWTQRGGTPPGWIGGAVYDPVSGLVFGRDVTTSKMWTYDVATNTWRDVAQGGTVPPPAGESGFQFLGFDRSADRLVLYRESGTWLFDPRAGSWAHPSNQVPVSFFIGGPEMPYDEANGRTLVYGEGRIAAFDATTSEWRLLYPTGTQGGGGGSRLDRWAGLALAYDPLNVRLVVVGGAVPGPGETRQPVDDVVAFDLRTDGLIKLLAPSSTRPP